MHSSKDDFKWFGEGFDGFPKRLPDDCVEYAIYILDPVLQDSQIRERLRKVHSAANVLTKHLLKGFIWQREPFGLELVRENGTSLLRGRTNYGDSVEDEWLIVYVLRQLSIQFEIIWIKVVDTDGEFLLVEAANALPRWLNPEIANNRVWLNSGRLLIIPHRGGAEQTSNTRRMSGALTLQEASQFIEEDHSRLLHSPLVEAEAFYRLRNYPKQIADSLHHALAKIPRSLAYVLHENAAYVNPAVEAFYLRDPIAMRPLQTTSSRDHVFPPNDLVATLVKFTKVGYAQLKSQHFSAPPSWAGVSAEQVSAKLKAQAETGMKLTCGFEMLMSDPQNQDTKAVREIKLLLEDIATGEDELPSDNAMSTWTKREDDEAWLDINFEDLEKELGGKATGDTTRPSGGFGDKSAEENLRKMVARFEDFLNDDDAGSEGAQCLDEMDNDDDDGDSEEGNSISSEDEDKEVSFDEAQFATMMREMMGVPAETEAAASNADRNPDQPPHLNTDESSDAEATSEEEEIRRLTQLMEAELKDAGALQIDRASKVKELQKQRLERNQDNLAADDSDHESGDENDGVNIDYNLAKNLLESFKSQAGMAGPGGNLMGLMGLQMPRDEDDAGKRYET